MLKLLFIALGLSLFAVALVIIVMVGAERQEFRDCLNWREQANTYPTFYLTDWQKQQCDHYGITIKAIAGTK